MRAQVLSRNTASAGALNPGFIKNVMCIIRKERRREKT
jgi:hypothetical protein